MPTGSYLYPDTGVDILPDGTDFILRRNAQVPDHALALHYHDHYEAFYALSGDMLYAVEGRRYQLEAGNLLIIAPYELHQLVSGGNGGAERISLRFRKELLTKLSSPACNLAACFDTHTGHPNLLKLNDRQQRQAVTTLNNLLAETSSCAFGRTLAESALLTQFFLLINRAFRDGSQADPIRDSFAQMVQAVVEYIELNYASPVTLEILSKQFGVDRYQLSRAFTRLVGCPPHRFLIQKRLQKVEQLLRNGISPQEAAYQCGFSDYTNFYRRFKTAYGIGPRAWQNILVNQRTDCRTQ